MGYHAARRPCVLTAAGDAGRDTSEQLSGDEIMAKAEINAGICGFKTTVEAHANGDGTVHLTVESDCKAVCKMAVELQDVDPFREFTWRRSPQTLQVAPQCLSHPACPVPSGIIKVVEVEAGLALPADVTIVLSK
jgi:hypothetical protein